MIQTRFPDHPLLQTLVRHGYPAFAHQALAERRASQLPPYSHQAMLRAEAPHIEQARSLLDEIAEWARSHAVDGVEIWGPVPAPMTRRAGLHRVHLLFQAAQRDALHRMLDPLPAYLSRLPAARRARWSLDVDPIDLY